jgi:phage regulator Rha-like protein
LLDVSPSALSRALGTKRAYHKAPSYDDIEKARKEGFTHRQIAEMFEVSLSTVTRVIANHKKEEPVEKPLDPGFKRVSLTMYKGAMTEYRIMDNGNVSFRLPNSKERITLYGNEVQKMLHDLESINNYISSIKNGGDK